MWLLICVNFFMTTQMWFLNESFPTGVTGMRSLTCVNSPMSNQFGFPLTKLSTYVTYQMLMPVLRFTLTLWHSVVYSLIVTYLSVISILFQVCISSWSWVHTLAFVMISALCFRRDVRNELLTVWFWFTVVNFPINRSPFLITDLLLSGDHLLFTDTLLVKDWREIGNKLTNNKHLRKCILIWIISSSLCSDHVTVKFKEYKVTNYLGTDANYLFLINKDQLNVWMSINVWNVVMLIFLGGKWKWISQFKCYIFVLLQKHFFVLTVSKLCYWVL